MSQPITRRSFHRLLAAGAMLGGGWHLAQQPARSGLGLVVYCRRYRRDALRKSSDRDLYEPFTFLDHCQRSGAGGMQVPLGVMDDAKAQELRGRAEKNDIYIEAIISSPKQRSDLERFEQQVRTAAQAGALAVRTTIIPGRRYEYFKSMQQFKELDARARRSLEMAAPIAEKYKIPIAVENHKDHRDQQRVELFEHISSEYVGACVDTGNSFALLEDPIETIQQFAPWAHAVHLKDQALQLYPDGFLLGDIPLGQGGLDLKRMVAILRKAKPEIRFTLELITRDPLKVPCLLPEYWVTFPQLPASDLARTLRYVRDHTSDQLQDVTSLSAEARLKLEDQNVRASLDYARDVLDI